MVLLRLGRHDVVSRSYLVLVWLDLLLVVFGRYGGSGGGLVQSVQLYLSNVFTQHGRSFSATTAFYVKAALEAASSSEDYGKSDQRTDVLQPVGVSTAAGSQAASAIPIGASSFATRFLGFVEENLFT